jgi:hypothetical protein
LLLRVRAAGADQGALPTASGRCWQPAGDADALGAAAEEAAALEAAAEEAAAEDAADRIHAADGLGL